MPKRTEPSPPLSAAPPNAIPVWTDGLSLFTELPTPSGQPYVIRYPLTASGLSSALGLIRTNAFDGLDRSPTSPLPAHTHSVDRAMAALEVLRKVGIVPTARRR
jgi:hypothetical protein